MLVNFIFLFLQGFIVLKEIIIVIKIVVFLIIKNIVEIAILTQNLKISYFVYMVVIVKLKTV